MDYVDDVDDVDVDDHTTNIFGTYRTSLHIDYIRSWIHMIYSVLDKYTQALL
jgi:hypothetical protein